MEICMEKEPAPVPQPMAPLPLPEIDQLFQWETYAQNLTQTMEQLYRFRKYSDVILCAQQGCGAQLFHAHRFVLGSSSQYFADIFDNATSPTNGTTPYIMLPPEATASAMTYLLEYVYTGETSVPPHKLEDVKRVGKLLQLKGFGAATIRVRSLDAMTFSQTNTQPQADVTSEEEPPPLVPTVTTTASVTQTTTSSPRATSGGQPLDLQTVSKESLCQDPPELSSQTIASIIGTVPTITITKLPSQQQPTTIQLPNLTVRPATKLVSLAGAQIFGKVVRSSQTVSVALATVNQAKYTPTATASVATTRSATVTTSAAAPVVTVAASSSTAACYRPASTKSSGQHQSSQDSRHKSNPPSKKSKK